MDYGLAAGFPQLPPGFSDVIIMWSLEFNKFPVMNRLYGNGIRTVMASFEKESIGHSSSVGRDEIIMR